MSEPAKRKVAALDTWRVVEIRRPRGHRPLPEAAVQLLARLVLQIENQKQEG